MLDRELTGRRPENADDVNSQLIEEPAVTARPDRGQTPEPAQLPHRDRLDRGPEADARTSLHLAGDQIAPVGGDYVDLAIGTPVVPVQDAEAGFLQVLGSQLLALPAERVLGMHVHHLRHRPCRSRLPRGVGRRPMWTVRSAAAQACGRRPAVVGGVWLDVGLRTRHGDSRIGGAAAIRNPRVAGGRSWPGPRYSHP